MKCVWEASLLPRSSTLYPLSPLFSLCEILSSQTVDTLGKYFGSFLGEWSNKEADAVSLLSKSQCKIDKAGNSRDDLQAFPKNSAYGTILNASTLCLAMDVVWRIQLDNEDWTTHNNLLGWPINFKRGIPAATKATVEQDTCCCVENLDRRKQDYLLQKNKVERFRGSPIEKYEIYGN